MITFHAFHLWGPEPLEFKVRKGAQLYAAKHGGELPNLCQVHKSRLPQEITIDGIRVMPISSCLHHDYLYARVETQATQAPLF